MVDADALGNDICAAACDLTSLPDRIQGLGLSRGQTQSARATADIAVVVAGRGQTGTAAQIPEALAAEVRAQSGEAFGPEDAQALLGWRVETRASLGH